MFALILSLIKLINHKKKILITP